MSRPTIAILFQQTLPLGVDPGSLVKALQRYLDDILFPAHGVNASLVIKDAAGPNDLDFVVADDSDQAGSLGYHDLQGTRPRGFAFLRSAQNAGVSISEDISHELCEMLKNPACNKAVITPRGRLMAEEIADMVEGSPVTVDGFPMANFVYPSWFGFGSAPFDLAGVCSQAWEILSGGYVPVWDGTEFVPLFGSPQAQQNFTAREVGQSFRRVARLNSEVVLRKEFAYQRFA
jgi:hypothetical protein